MATIAADGPRSMIMVAVRVKGAQWSAACHCLYLSLAANVVNRRLTTVDMSLDPGETPMKGPLKVRTNSALICDPVHCSDRLVVALSYSIHPHCAPYILHPLFVAPRCQHYQASLASIAKRLIAA